MAAILAMSVSVIVVLKLLGHGRPPGEVNIIKGKVAKITEAENQDLVLRVEIVETRRMLMHQMLDGPLLNLLLMMNERRSR